MRDTLGGDVLAEHLHAVVEFSLFEDAVLVGISGIEGCHELLLLLL